MARLRSKGRFSRDEDSAGLVRRYYCDILYRSAKRRQLVVGISRDQILYLLSLPCTYCGSIETRSRHGHTAICGGIDRIDSSIDYVESNVVPCCKTCNYAKNNLTMQQFRDWINRLIAFNMGQNVYR